MSRPRSFIWLALLVCCFVSPAAAAEKVARLGFLGSTGREAIEKPFWQGLRDLGWIEGQNLVVERRLVGGSGARYPEIAAELVRLNPDVLVSIAGPATAAVTKATTSIPIVFTEVGDPVALGVVSSLARPGGNVTGISSLNTELSGKRLELLRAVVPRLTHVSVVACCLGTPAQPNFERYLGDTAIAARAMKITTHPIRLKNVDDPETLFATIMDHRADAVIFLPGTQMNAARGRFVDLSMKHRLPTMFDNRIYADAGGLMAYGIDRDESYRRAASLVDRVLKGTRPADIPVEQPTKLKFVLNLKTAKAIGVTIPASVLLRADEIIQ